MANSIDPRLFAGELQPEVNPQIAAQQDVGALDAGDVPVPLEAAVRGTRMAAEAAAARQAGDRERAGAWEAAGASVRTSLLGRVYDKVMKPAFESEPGFDMAKFVKNLPMVLSDDEKDYLEGTRSSEEARYKLGIIEDQRTATQAMGDSPLAAFAGGFIDPTMLVLTPAGAAAVRLGKGAMAARAAGAAASAAATGGIIAAGEGPMSEGEIVLNVLANAAAGSFAYQPGKGLVRADPDFPADGLQRSLAPVAHADPVDTVARVDRALTRSQSIAEGIQWNIRKTMSSYGDVGKRIADILFDNNTDLSVNSVESHRAAVLTDLRRSQFQYEDMLRNAMADEGYGWFNRILKNKQASAAQAQIEHDLRMELHRRELMHERGLPIADSTVNPRITAMADKLDEMHALAARELKASGALGAEAVEPKPGWFSRRWSTPAIEGVMERFRASGMSATQADNATKNLVALAVRRGSPGMDREVARDIGGAIVNRALRKGYFEDAMFNPTSAGERAALRDMLTNEGLSGQRLARVMHFFEGQVDEAGKASFLKHRMNLDYKAAHRLPDGTMVRVTDMIDNNMTSNVQQYLDGVATQVALARKGIVGQSAIDNLRSELSHSIKDPVKRKEAVTLFDNVMNHMHGRPAGEEVTRGMRMMQQYGRMISLSNSGLWQLSEYAPLMAKYGVVKAMKYAVKELPLIRTMLSDLKHDKGMARSLGDVLTAHSENNVRLRPFLQKFEDNFEIGAADSTMLAMQQAGQLVPYVNMMKFVHGHQARVASNLILDRLEQAAKGNVKAQEALAKYGIGSQVSNKLFEQIKQHKWNVDAWDDAVWREVRPAFGKMMDEAVLHGRMGDTPAFAAFDKVGKFIFTYRSFMLNSHNKILAGSLARDGIVPTTFMLAYQFPLAVMAVHAQQALQGKSPKESDVYQKALGQMGALGFGAEFSGVLSGQKREWGSPALIPVDRAIQLVGQASQGNFAQAGATAASALPIFSLLQPVKGLKELAKD